MKAKYDDILSRIDIDPLWYGYQGVPRFDAFHPNMCSSIYVDEALLLKIRCQECHKEFLVEMNFSKSNRLQSLEYRVIHYKAYFMNPIHYGDPPRHNECVGETMNAESIQIMEFWKREELDWVRKPDYEIQLMQTE